MVLEDVMFYVKWSIVEYGGSVIIPVKDIGQISEEIKNLHDGENTEMTIKVQIVEMDEKEFEALPEFTGW